MVASRGDALAELVERERLGAVADPGDVAGFAAACERMLGPCGRRGAAADRGGRAGAALEQRRGAAGGVVRGRRDAPAGAPSAAPRMRRAALAQYRWALRETLADEGAGAAAKRVGRRLRRAVRLR